jgi:hypothetical protein
MSSLKAPTVLWDYQLLTLVPDEREREREREGLEKV